MSSEASNNSYSSITEYQPKPELIRVVSDNFEYAKLVVFVGDKQRLTNDDLLELTLQVNDDESIAQNIIDLAKSSMGQALSAQGEPVLI